MGNEQCGQRHEEGPIGSKELCFTSTSSNDFVMALNKASVTDLKSIGLRPEIAKKLVEDKEQGKLKSLSDVVSALETSGARCQVKFENDFKVELSEKGEVELRVRRESKKEKPKNPDKWTSKWGTEEENKPTAAKRKGLEAKAQGYKKMKALEDEDWDVSDEESDEDNMEEGGEEVDKTNVNTASEEELEKLPFIGPSLARKIIKYREEHGDFRRIQALSAVRGISKRLVRELFDMLTVGETQKGAASTKLNPVPTNGCLQYEGREIVRVMSWNLKCFSDEKGANKGVLEVICRTILENG